MRRRTPILMLSADALPEHVQAGKAAGADGHLAKPIRPAERLAGIAGVLEPGEQPARPHQRSAGVSSRVSGR